MDPKRPTSPLQAAPRGSSAARASSASRAPARVHEAVDEPLANETPTLSVRSRPDLTLIKTSQATLSSDTVTVLPTMMPGADAETVQTLERLRSLSPALEFPFGAQRFDAEAFFALPETPDDARTYELIDGVVVVSPSVLPTHSFFTLNLLVALFQVTRERGLGPVFFEVDVSPNPSLVVRPDVMWYGDLQTDDETLAKRLIGHIPWVVLETLSESTQKYDQVEKRIKYQQMGVLEYWILNPKKKWLEVHHFVQRHGGQGHGAKGQVTRLEKPTEVLTTDLLPGWSLSVGALFDPEFDPYAEKSAALMRDFHEKQQSLEDAISDEQERRAQAEEASVKAEVAAQEERVLRQLESERRALAEAAQAQADERRAQAEAAQAQAEAAQAQADERRAQADERRAQADERRAQADAARAQAEAAAQVELERRQTAEALTAAACAREAELLARLELLERKLGPT